MKNPKYLPLLLASAALFGCTVGPRFEPPAVAIPQRYIGQVSDAASDLGWWKLFNDTTLVRLVSTALRNNRNIAVALSRVEQARLTLKATKASLGPSVGYGLEGVIPDITAGRILDNEMIPRFREGDIYGGIDRTADVLMQLSRGEFTAEQYDERTGDGADAAVLFVLIPLILFMILLL